MEQKHRNIINDNLDKLAELSNFESIIQLVLNNHRNIFLESQLMEFQKPEFQRKGEAEKCRYFYKTIQTRGPSAYSFLLQILKDSKHDRLYKLLCNPDRSSSVPWDENMVVTPSQSFPNDPMIYKMTSFPRGRYIIINNMKFKADTPRRGAENDVLLEKILSAMGFCGNYYENKTVQEMRKLLLEFSSDELLSQVDSCIVALMSHGTVDEMGNDCIKGVDSLMLSRYDVLEMFNEDQCKLRRGCPKIFIIQTCRGDGETNLVGGVVRRSKVTDKQHPFRDTIVLTPCVEGMKSNRDRQEGTWFIVALCEVFQKHAHSHSLDQMASMINDKFDEYFCERGAETHQVQCYIEYGVGKILYFNPGLYEN